MGDNAADASNANPDVCFELADVEFAVGGNPLLTDVDLTLSPGRVTALIGHNGSGKSTLMRLLARQQSPTGGSIRYRGYGLEQWDQRAFAREVAYLAQQLPDATGLTVRELAALGRYPWHGALGRFGNDDRDRVSEALRLTDMAGLGDRMVDTLSGGERQRAWLAMLVAQNSHCMLLDEPLAALDVAHQAEVMELVRALCRERGLSVVVVVHDINIAARYCDELIALRDGRPIARGAPEEVVQPERLQQIYGLPMGVLSHPDREIPISYVA